jgi:hypothetical protein
LSGDTPEEVRYIHLRLSGSTPEEVRSTPEKVRIL